MPRQISKNNPKQKLIPKSKLSLNIVQEVNPRPETRKGIKEKTQNFMFQEHKTLREVHISRRITEEKTNLKMKEQTREPLRKAKKPPSSNFEITCRGRTR